MVVQSFLDDFLDASLVPQLLFLVDYDGFLNCDWVIWNWDTIYQKKNIHQ